MALEETTGSLPISKVHVLWEENYHQVSVKASKWQNIQRKCLRIQGSLLMTKQETQRP